MIFIESDCHDPYFNLAMEQYVFDRLPREEDYFMLWQNENTIVVGKYQNTAAEVNASFVREHKIRVARRLSGGGAVYHDLGNINYTFITDAQKGSRLNFEKFCRPLVRVLQSLGVPAQVSGRNDVTIEGMKCSGSSQYIREGRIMHHGTILFDSDLDVLGKALIVPEDKIVSKGVASVRSRVTNIRPFLREDMDVDAFRKVLREGMGAGSRRSSFSPDELEQIRALRDQRYARWEWNVGSSPPAELTKARRIEGCGRIELSLKLQKGTIASLAFHGDYFGNRDSEELAGILQGCRLQESALLQRLAGTDLEEYFHGIDRESFLSLLLE